MIGTHQIFLKRKDSANQTLLHSQNSPPKPIRTHGRSSSAVSNASDLNFIRRFHTLKSSTSPKNNCTLSSYPTFYNPNPNLQLPQNSSQTSLTATPNPQTPPHSTTHCSIDCGFQCANNVYYFPPVDILDAAALALNFSINPDNEQLLADIKSQLSDITFIRLSDMYSQYNICSLDNPHLAINQIQILSNQFISNLNHSKNISSKSIEPFSRPDYTLKETHSRDTSSTRSSTHTHFSIEKSLPDEPLDNFFNNTVTKRKSIKPQSNPTTKHSRKNKTKNLLNFKKLENVHPPKKDQSIQPRLRNSTILVLKCNSLLNKPLPPIKDPSIETIQNSIYNKKIISELAAQAVHINPSSLTRPVEIYKSNSINSPPVNMPISRRKLDFIEKDVVELPIVSSVKKANENVNVDSIKTNSTSNTIGLFSHTNPDKNEVFQSGISTTETISTALPSKDTCPSPKSKFSKKNTNYNINHIYTLNNDSNSSIEKIIETSRGNKRNSANDCLLPVATNIKIDKTNEVRNNRNSWSPNSLKKQIPEKENHLYIKNKYPNVIIDTTFPVPLPLFARLLFFGLPCPKQIENEFSSEKINYSELDNWQRNNMVSQGLKDINIERWSDTSVKPNDSIKVSYLKPLGTRISSKSATVDETWTVLNVDYHNCVAFDVQIRTPNIPMGQSFTVELRYSLTSKVDKNGVKSTRLFVGYVSKWTKNSWLKTAIDLGISTGNKKSAQILLKNLNQWIDANSNLQTVSNHNLGKSTISNSTFSENSIEIKDPFEDSENSLNNCEKTNTDNH
ncbi:hypothetical protein BB558_003103, partial [Smittium angustum]